MHTLSDVQYDEYFGFTDAEVRRLLADYDMTEKYSEVKEWYNGYRFGQEDIYCPWDVLNYVSDHLADPDVEPKLYWVNSSGYSDILVEMPRERMGCIFEVKYAESGPLDAACGDALAQIHEKDYAEKLRRDGMKEIHLYAVACRLKESRIVYERGEEAENRNKETNPMMQM